MYLVCTVTSSTDVDNEDHLEFLGVAMSEERAKKIMNSYEPGDSYIKKDDYCWEWPRESRWDHAVTIEIYYVPVDVL